MITKEDLRNLIALIKRWTGKTQREISEGAGYAPNSLSELLAQKNGNCEPAYKQLEIVYGKELKNSMPRSPALPEERFTADQLFHMYMKAMERQDILMDAQTAILKNIESKMALEETQGRIEVSLKRTLAAALTVSKGQEDGMKELRDLFSQVRAQKNPPSEGDGKGRRRIDGGFEKKGKSPA